jgi:hypothetical protein
VEDTTEELDMVTVEDTTIEELATVEVEDMDTIA